MAKNDRFGAIAFFRKKAILTPERVFFRFGHFGGLFWGSKKGQKRVKNDPPEGGGQNGGFPKMGHF